MKFRYFAWVRERIGLDEENIDLPTSVKTVADVLAFLQMRGSNYDYALENKDLIRVALDQTYFEHDAPIEGIIEIALFPPMTGG